MRPEVNVKVKVTQNGMQPKRNRHTKFGIPTSKNYGRYAPDTIILETRSYVKITVT